MIAQSAACHASVRTQVRTPESNIKAGVVNPGVGGAGAGQDRDRTQRLDDLWASLNRQSKLSLSNFSFSERMSQKTQDGADEIAQHKKDLVHSSLTH